MTNSCQKFAILGYDTRQDCLDANKDSDQGETSNDTLDTGDILAIVFGVIIVLMLALGLGGTIYFFGQRFLRLINRFLAACQRTANTFAILRHPVVKFLLRTKDNETEKTDKTKTPTPKSEKTPKCEHTTEKKNKRKTKKVTIKTASTPKSRTVKVQAVVEPVNQPDTRDNKVSFLNLKKDIFSKKTKR